VVLGGRVIGVAASVAELAAERGWHYEVVRPGATVRRRPPRPV
jgi:hypothetical protein